MKIRRCPSTPTTPSRLGRRVALAMVVTVLTPLGACGNEDDAGSATTTTSATDTTLPVDTSSSPTGSIDGPVLVSPTRTAGEAAGMAAEVKGVLVFDESTSCVLMALEDVRYSLVWPAGTSWQEDPPAVLLTDGEAVEPGMMVYGGGGYLYRDDVEQLAGSAVADAAERCTGATGEIAFFNIDSEVDVIAD